MLKNKSVVTLMAFAPLAGCLQTDPQSKTEPSIEGSFNYASMEDTASQEILDRMREDSRKWNIPIGRMPGDFSQPVPSVSASESAPALGKSAVDPHCIVWENPNYTGRSLRINPNDNYQDLRHTNNGSYNDMITSVQVFNNSGLNLYRDLTFTGGGYVVATDIPNLALHGFNDYTTSITWRDRPPAAPNAGIRICSNPNMTGVCMNIVYPMTINSLTGYNFNDVVSSASLINGETIAGILYADPSWTGATFIVNSLNQNVPAAFNDRATGFRWAGI